MIEVEVEGGCVNTTGNKSVGLAGSQYVLLCRCIGEVLVAAGVVGGGMFPGAEVGLNRPCAVIVLREAGTRASSDRSIRAGPIGARWHRIGPWLRRIHGWAGAHSRAAALQSESH